MASRGFFISMLSACSKLFASTFSSFCILLSSNFPFSQSFLFYIHFRVLWVSGLTSSITIIAEDFWVKRVFRTFSRCGMVMSILYVNSRIKVTPSGAFWLRFPLSTVELTLGGCAVGHQLPVVFHDN